MMSRPLVQTWTKLQYALSKSELIKPNIHSGLIYYQTCRNVRLYKENTIRAMYWRSRSKDVVVYAERRRDEFQDWNYRSEIYAFSRRLQEELSEDTLRKIFTHNSYLDLLKVKQAELELAETNFQSNKDLIDRGKVLLELSLKPYLRYTFRKMPEDGISEITKYLSSTKVLADVAKWIGCKDIVLTAEWPPNEETMANTVFALLGGIELDADLNRVRRFVIDIIFSYLNDKDILDDVWLIPNPNETLNFILENNKLPHYEPRIMFQTGIRTLEACHMVGLYVNEKLIGSSVGETLPIAEECAALESLRNLFDLTDSKPPFAYGNATEKIEFKLYEKKHDDIKSWKFSPT